MEDEDATSRASPPVFIPTPEPERGADDTKMPAVCCVLCPRLCVDDDAKKGKEVFVKKCSVALVATCKVPLPHILASSFGAILEPEEQVLGCGNGRGAVCVCVCGRGGVWRARMMVQTPVVRRVTAEATVP